MREPKDHAGPRIYTETYRTCEGCPHYVDEGRVCDHPRTRDGMIGGHRYFARSHDQRQVAAVTPDWCPEYNNLQGLIVMMNDSETVEVNPTLVLALLGLARDMLASTYRLHFCAQRREILPDTELEHSMEVDQYQEMMAWLKSEEIQQRQKSAIQNAGDGFDPQVACQEILDLVGQRAREHAIREYQNSPPPGGGVE